jgi:hypothetical protein
MAACRQSTPWTRRPFPEGAGSANETVAVAESGAGLRAIAVGMPSRRCRLLAHIWHMSSRPLPQIVVIGTVRSTDD